MSSTAKPQHYRLAQGIKALRAERKWTQEQLSRKSGLHATEISRIESGERSPHLKTLQKVAAGLKVPCWFLVALEDGLTWGEISRLRQVADSF
jgi:transcriptional regulator with XRE-family HTH domain